MKVDERKEWIEYRLGRSLEEAELQALRNIERNEFSDLYYIFGLIERAFNHGQGWYNKEPKK